MDGNGISGGLTLYMQDDQVMQFLALEKDNVNDILVEVNDPFSQMSREIFGKA